MAMVLSCVALVATVGRSASAKITLTGVILISTVIACCFILLPTIDACRPKVNCRSYVIPRNFGFKLYLICCLLRCRAGRHHATCVFVVKKEHYDFWADNSIFHDVFHLVTASSPFCSVDVALSKTVSCVHTATSSAEEANM